jgi:hypothetical protein
VSALPSRSRPSLLRSSRFPVLWFSVLVGRGCYSLMDSAWSQVFITRVICDIGCPVIEVISFQGTQQNRFFPSPEDGNRSSFRNVVFFLVCFFNTRTMDRVRKPNISDNLTCFIYGTNFLSMSHFSTSMFEIHNLRGKIISFQSKLF